MMETVCILYDWADEQEGTVRTVQWGWCYSSTCNHVSHDPAFSYSLTEITGEILWTGIKGDYLVKSSETGRVFLTRYWEGDTEEERRYRPEMWTVELIDLAHALDYINHLADDWHYRSPRHECLLEYRLACIRAFDRGVEEGR